MSAARGSPRTSGAHYSMRQTNQRPAAGAPYASPYEVTRCDDGLRAGPSGANFGANIIEHGPSSPSSFSYEQRAEEMREQMAEVAEAYEKGKGHAHRGEPKQCVAENGDAAASFMASLGSCDDGRVGSLWPANGAMVTETTGDACKEWTGTGATHTGTADSPPATHTSAAVDQGQRPGGLYGDGEWCKVGRSVWIAGLKSRPELNGIRAEVVAAPCEGTNGRVDVRVTTGRKEETVSVKPGNLCAQQPTAGSCSSAAGGGCSRGSGREAEVAAPPEAAAANDGAEANSTVAERSGVVGGNGKERWVAGCVQARGPHGHAIDAAAKVTSEAAANEAASRPRGKRSAEAEEARRAGRQLRERKRRVGAPAPAPDASCEEAAPQELKRRACEAERRAEQAERLLKLTRKQKRRDERTAAERGSQAARSSAKQVKRAKKKLGKKQQQREQGAARREHRRELKRKGAPAGEPLHSSDRKHQRLFGSWQQRNGTGSGMGASAGRGSGQRPR